MEPRVPRAGRMPARPLARAAACALIAWLWPAAPVARAQTPPAGNAHPTPQAVTGAEEGLVNPFGPVDWSGVHRTASQQREAARAKAGFAAKVDLSPLRDVAVFHSRRVKILDTLARETVRRITGRARYREDTPTGEPAERGVDGRSFDPLFTFLDLMIDPGHYADRALVHVDFTPLREKLLEAAIPDDAAGRRRWFSLTRVSPRMVAAHGAALESRHLMEPGFARAFDSLAVAMDLYRSGDRNLEVVAPASSDDPYRHLASLPEDSPARRAAAALGRAWRAGDADGVNAAARALAAELPRINPEVYPGARRQLELAYNRVNAFEWGVWVYGAAFLALVLALGTDRRWLVIAGVALLAAAVALHAFGFVARCFIAERLAIQNQFESMTGVSLFANVVGSAIMAARRQWLFGAAAAGVGFLVLITATQTAIPGEFIEREAAILNTSVLLKYHVTTVLSSYGLISLGFLISAFYLCTHYAARVGPRRDPAAPLPVAAAALNLGAGEPRGPSRTLRDLDRAQMIVLQLAFWTLGVGILLGAWWADHSWGRFWGWDPKETWALVTWIVYLVVIHVRVAGGFDRGLVTAWLSVLGFFVMCWTYFGVNLLLPGLHAYA